MYNSTHVNNSFTPGTPEGTVTLKMWDKDRWTTDDFLGMFCGWGVRNYEITQGSL